jgi:hypothetical protein
MTTVRERSGWSHLEEAVISPPRPVGVLGHPIRRVMVVVITHQHNSMVKHWLGILSRPVYCLHTAEILEEVVEIYNSTQCSKGWFSMSASVILECGSGGSSEDHQQQQHSGLMLLTERGWWTYIAEVVSKPSSKAQLWRFLLQLIANI